MTIYAVTIAVAVCGFLIGVFCERNKPSRKYCIRCLCMKEPRQ